MAQTRYSFPPPSLGDLPSPRKCRYSVAVCSFFFFLFLVTVLFSCRLLSSSFARRICRSHVSQFLKRTQIRPKPRQQATRSLSGNIKFWSTTCETTLDTLSALLPADSERLAFQTSKQGREEGRGLAGCSFPRGPTRKVADERGRERLSKSRLPFSTWQTFARRRRPRLFAGDIRGGGREGKREKL